MLRYVDLWLHIALSRLDACSSKNNGPRLHYLRLLELLSAKFGIQSTSEKYTRIVITWNSVSNFNFMSSEVRLNVISVTTFKF